MAEQLERVQLGIKVDLRLWQRIKMQGIRENRSATKVVDDAFRMYLDAKRKEPTEDGLEG